MPTEGRELASSRWPWDGVTPDHFKVNSSAWGSQSSIDNVNIIPRADKFHFHLSFTSGQIIFTLAFYWNYSPWSFPLLKGAPVLISQFAQDECLGFGPLQGHRDSGLFPRLTNALTMAATSAPTPSLVLAPVDFFYFQVSSALNREVCMLDFSQNIHMFYFRRNKALLHLFARNATAQISC